MQATENQIQEMATANFLDAEAFAAFLEYENLELSEAVDAFQDQYAGTHASLEAWAENFMDETGYLSEMPENLRSYFDYEAWARDAELNGDIWTIDAPSGTAVFWSR